VFKTLKVILHIKHVWFWHVSFILDLLV